MNKQRLPAVLLAVTAAGFGVWAIVLILSPGGPVPMEWGLLAVAVALFGFGGISLRGIDPTRATLIRWLLTGFAVFGGLVVIGLTADDSSSRTWFWLGWAALVAGYVTAVGSWWSAPGVSRPMLIGGGVLGVVVVAAGVSITVNCDKTLQRSWCDPVYEQEEALATRVVVEGSLDRQGRAGGDTGAYIRAFLIEGTDIEAVTMVPEPFTFEERDVRSIEVARGRYTAESGPDANCQIDVKVEEVRAGNLETIIVSCTSAG